MDYNNETSSLNVQVCFPAGTPIILADGTTKNIENILPDDLVKTVNHQNPDGTIVEGKVVRTFKNDPQQLWHLNFGNFEIRTTKEHPFYVKGKGWVSAEELQIGDICRSILDTEIVLVAKEFESELVPVYNFEVQDTHTYFVGKNSTENVLVHNECSGKIHKEYTETVKKFNNGFFMKSVNTVEKWFSDWAWQGAKPYSKLPLGENWHVEKRMKLNQNEKFLQLTTELEKLSQQDFKNSADKGTSTPETILGESYILYPSGLSIYHSENGTGNDCWKYVGINGNGKEVVIKLNMQTGLPEIDMSPERMGTYNYFSGEEWVLEHIMFDVIPYWIEGNSPQDTTPFLKRIKPDWYNYFNPPKK